MDGAREDGAGFIFKAFAAMCFKLLHAQENGLFVGALYFREKFFACRCLGEVRNLREFFGTLGSELFRFIE